MIFVFGSNLAGRHGKGAALTAARKYGAIRGQGIGRQGNSYAIPTKDHDLSPLTLVDIKYWIRHFIIYARDHKDEQFLITPVGCGLAGYNQDQIGPMFADSPSNCVFADTWEHSKEYYANK